MSLQTRKRVVLAKIEGTYGTDPTPTGSANAMLVTNLTPSIVEAELVSRDLIRQYFGNSEQLMAQKYSKLDFEVEMVGGGVIGGIPGYDCLLRACAMSGAATTTTVTAAILSEVVTVTKTSHGLSTGDKIIPSGFTDTNANIAAGVAITVTGANTFTYPAPGAADDPSADGTPVYRTAYTYSPLSSSIESVTLYYAVGADSGNGPLHKITGARGTVELTIGVKQIPKLKFSFLGLYNDPSDAALPSTDFSGFMIPQVSNTQNTLAFSLAGYSANLESMNMNIANDVQYITLIGSEKVSILDRKPAGTFVLEAPTITAKDFFTLATAQTPGAVTITQDSRNGYKVKLDAPSVLIGNPNYQDANGVQMLSIPFTVNPVSGNDDFTITLK